MECTCGRFSQHTYKTATYCDNDNGGALGSNSDQQTENKTQCKTNIQCTTKMEKSGCVKTTSNRGLKSHSKRCVCSVHKSGRIQKTKTSFRNPYLNFLRDFRESNPNLTAIEAVQRGAKKWNLMQPSDKKPYIIEAHKAPKMVYRNRKSRCYNVSSCSQHDCGCPKKPKCNRRKLRKAKPKCRITPKKRKSFKCPRDARQ